MPSALARSTALRRLIIGGALAFSVLSCGREPMGAGGPNSGVRYSRAIAFNAEFPAGYAPLRQAQAASQAAQTAQGNLANQVGGDPTAFTQVRIVLRNADGSIALDVTVQFPPGASELTVPLNVPLPASAPAGGVPLALTLNYQDAGGTTVFTGGPVTVNAVPATPGAGPPPPAPVDIPLTYRGVGSTAAAVRITPKTLTVNIGQPFRFTAQAVDAGGTVIPNTPIIFYSEEPLRATVNAASGTGTAGSARGTTRIVAQLLTHQEDAAVLTIRAMPTALALVSGGGQTANVNTNVAQPVIVRVTAADGGGVDGVTVTFAAQNGGSVGSATAVTDATGNAQTTWRLGGTAGAQTMTASVAGLSGSPVTVNATGRAVDPVRLEVGTQPPSSATAGSPFGLVIRALTVSGDVAVAFTGPVSVALGADAPAGAVLSGTTTVSAVAGVATFSGLRLNRPGSYTLLASSSTLVGAVSGAFSVVAGPATRLSFQGYPVIGGVAGARLDPVIVIARDDFGNVATSYTGLVSLQVTEPGAALSAIRASAARTLSDVSATTSPPNLRLSMDSPVPARPARADIVLGTTTANAGAGVATFSDLRLTVAGTHSISASSGLLSGTTGPSFVISAAAAAAIQVAGGNGQTGPVSTALPGKIVASLTDAFGNAVMGPTVTFTPVSGSGTANPASAPAGGGGLAQTTWTLGPTAGSKSLVIGSAGLPSVTATATATGGGVAGAVQLGYPVEFPNGSGHAPNYLLGSIVNVSTATVLTHLAVIGKVAGTQVKMALYTDVSGSPGTLVAATTALSMAIGVNEFAVTPTALPAGNYWIMGIFNVSSSIGINSNNSDIVKYISLPFSSPLPTTFPTPIVYTGQRFNYYIRVQ